MLRHIHQDTAMREFHISRKARDRYQFDQTLFSIDGNVILANFRAALAFVQKMNATRDLARFPEQTIKAGQINAMGLIDEILHFIVARYRDEKNPDVMAQALAWLEEKVGKVEVDKALRKFTDAFPPVAVYHGKITVAEYLAGDTTGVPHRQIALEELLMLWLANMNPAFAPYLELFDDVELKQETSYLTLLTELHTFVKTQPSFGPENQNLVDMLRSPSIAVPYSLSGQLEYILTHWGPLLGRYLYRLLSSLDFIKEEEKPIFFGPGPSLVPLYDTGLHEPERFSPDKDWMPTVVLLAKNAHVWLDQLSRKYQRSITRLDHIPDEELATLATQGFTGLWLIGLWERSTASQRIKQMCGNPEAVASAYSLHTYEIAQDIGGQEGLANLRERAWRHGIRLASDMVPNHMGIDSRWVIEHPDWFISLDYSPFPAYTFNGPNLSGDERVGIFLEDRYYNRTDAAVVFKRVDSWTGNEKYIYHGNDGTSMPWNDTAQLNFLHPEAREAVIQTILNVARQVPIIRFDAAMTLTKRHYQRLWFPEPGSGGAIPSRAEHGLTRQQFNDAMPNEFWREVVDRVAQEAPDTLLLAEAFWLMEGYFVRTLGMHRVYNSAFMNMLRDEDNAKYRWVMKNTLEFDPQILKRFVNFMNNPDEHTAVEQFGKGDKYFGICTMMVTLPGLPMFGHGQIEGFAEKYGMEYRRAYWDEHPDRDLVQRHEREIFPLLHRRHLFAEVEHFVLYDFWTPEGHVNEDVFAYSNRSGDERALIVYHNKFAEVRGWIRTSVGAAIKGPDGSKRIEQRILGEALALHHDERYFTIFRDNRSGLEYIRRSKELCERGLYVELAAYTCHVFMDLREVCDNEWRHYEHITAYLNGRGVPSIDAALQEILLQPVHQPFIELVNADLFRRLMKKRVTGARAMPDKKLLEELEGKAQILLHAIKEFTGGRGDEAAVARQIRDRLKAALRLPVLMDGEIGVYLRSGLDDDPTAWGTLCGWLFVHNLGKMAAVPGFEEVSRSWLDEWQLGRIVSGALLDLGLAQETVDYAVTLIKLLTTHQRWLEGGDTERLYKMLFSLLQDPDVQRALLVNRHQDILWFNKEAFEQILWWMFVITTIAFRATASKRATAEMLRCWEIIRALQQVSEASGYQVEKLLEGAKGLQAGKPSHREYE
jgi:glycosidase